jgi:hypothetical protein
MKTINETFTNDELEALKEQKGDRTWREAILKEFGVHNEVEA